MANEGTIRIHRSIGGTGAAFRVTFVPYGGEGEEAAVAGERSFHELQQVRAFLQSRESRKEQRIMAYSDKVVDHYNNPRNVGSMPKEDPNVGTGLVGAPECGDVMKLQMKINPDTQVIEEAKFKTFGCGSAIASSSLATEWVKGKTVEEALSIKNTDIVRELSLPPVKIHCSVLAEDAIKAAIGDWKKKHGVEVPVAEKVAH